MLIDMDVISFGSRLSIHMAGLLNPKDSLRKATITYISVFYDVRVKTPICNFLL